MRTGVRLTVGVMVVTAMVLAGRAEAADANGPYYAEPSWDQKLDAATRFIVLLNWNSEAVLDRETGLVWEQSPSAAPFTWLGAQTTCTQRIVGNRKGWRLPTIQELASLVDGDPANTSSPRLPPGHPFGNVQPSFYWSATTSAESTSAAWFVDPSGGVFTGEKFNGLLIWCVRGGQGVATQ